MFCGVTGVVVIALCGYGGCCRPYHSSSSGEWDITPGEPGSDYPVLTHIPPTGFQCKDRLSGYYADIDTRCQVSTSIIFLFFFFFFLHPPVIVVPIIVVVLDCCWPLFHRFDYDILGWKLSLPVVFYL